ncbi:hypothetical protein JW905_13060 [bacterium]|nr:hypothetical protein [candidate division CSSED10-310 bacterium]
MTDAAFEANGLVSAFSLMRTTPCVPVALGIVLSAVSAGALLKVAPVPANAAGKMVHDTIRSRGRKNFFRPINILLLILLAKQPV